MGLPGVQIHRLAGQLNHSQRHQDQLAPEITRWQKSNARTLPTNQVNMAPCEPSSPTTASPGYPNTPEKQDLDLKSHLMMLI